MDIWESAWLRKAVEGTIERKVLENIPLENLVRKEISNKAS